MGYTTTSGGNLSLKDSEGNIWMTPSGLDKGSLREGDMVCITPDGAFRGRGKPSCEYPFHLKIYELCPEVNAIVHAHPDILMGMSLTHRVPTPLLSPLSWLGGKIGLCGFGIPGSQRLMEEVSVAVSHGCDSLIMGNHGALATSTVDLTDAFCRFESLVHCAQREWYAHIWDTPVALKQRQVETLNELLCAPERCGESPEEGETLRQRRQELVHWHRRAGAQRLFTATSGEISLRTGEDDFLMTAEKTDRMELQASNLARIVDGHYVGTKVPEKTWRIHRDIYRQQPEIGAIITAYCPCLMGILSTAKPIDTFCMPESALILRRFPCMQMGDFLKTPEKLAAMVSLSQPAVGLRNGFLIMAGRTVKDAFDGMEVAEFTARAMLQAATYGGAVPLKPQDLSEMVAFYGLE